MMLPLTTLALVLAQSRTETGKTNQTSWWPLVIAVIVLAFLAVAFFVRRSRRALGDPPAGSVPASEVDQYMESGRMSTPAEETRRQP